MDGDQRFGSNVVEHILERFDAGMTAGVERLFLHATFLDKIQELDGSEIIDVGNRL